MSVEINLILELAKAIAKSFDGGDCNVKIWEIYHNLKVVDHKVMLTSEDEQIEFSHERINRNTYAKDVIRVVLWSLSTDLVYLFYIKNVLEILR